MKQKETKQKEAADPSMFVAAYLLFQTAETAQPEKQPGLGSTLAKFMQLSHPECQDYNTILISI